jgi:uncharacterized membrane protein
LIQLILLALPVIILSYTAQVLIKQGVNNLGEFGWEQLSGDPLSFMRNILTNLYILGGFALAGLGAIVYMFLLAKGDFTVVFPVLGAVGFVLLPIIGWLFLRETVTPQRIIGTLIIALGMIIVARS